MEPNLLWPLVMFAFVSTVTPGPNNIMLMTSGANVGFVRTLPHMLGIVLGFSLMLLLVGIGRDRLVSGLSLVAPVTEFALYCLHGVSGAENRLESSGKYQ